MVIREDASAVLLRTLHEKESHGLRVSLGNYEVEGKRLYGVATDGHLEFLGTKAEARAYYGSWRKGKR